MPKTGDVVTTPETTFPMTVESFDPNTMTCALVGFAPGSAELTRLDQVCAMELKLVPSIVR
ncbi:hypothetical protein [Hymenobacter glacieicola]|nr:hypothetical protein [Hymenobacter glacieicola]